MWEWVQYKPPSPTSTLKQPSHALTSAAGKKRKKKNKLIAAMNRVNRTYKRHLKDQILKDRSIIPKWTKTRFADIRQNELRKTCGVTRAQFDVLLERLSEPLAEELREMSSPVSAEEALLMALTEVAIGFNNNDIVWLFEAYHVPYETVGPAIKAAFRMMKAHLYQPKFPQTTDQWLKNELNFRTTCGLHFCGGVVGSTELGISWVHYDNRATHKLFVALDPNGLPMFAQVLPRVVPDTIIYRASGFEAELLKAPPLLLNWTDDGVPRGQRLFWAGAQGMGPEDGYCLQLPAPPTIDVKLDNNGNILDSSLFNRKLTTTHRMVKKWFKRLEKFRGLINPIKEFTNQDRVLQIEAMVALFGFLEELKGSHPEDKERCHIQCEHSIIPPKYLNETLFKGPGQRMIANVEKTQYHVQFHAARPWLGDDAETDEGSSSESDEGSSSELDEEEE